MKKVLLAITSALIFLNASASNVDKIQFANAGDASLGIMLGLPPHHRANMPFVSLDGMVGIKDGFINTKTFGQNGAIDLGAYIGFCHYGEAFEDWKWASWELPIVFRGGFHWEFVKNLDTYAGLQCGVAICHAMEKDKITDDRYYSNGFADGIFGMYLGAKWMFTSAFGVKLEFSSDWLIRYHEPDLDHHNEYIYVGRRYRYGGYNLPPVSAGVTFNF